MIPLLVAVALLAAAAAPALPSGEEVMRRVNARPRGGDAEMSVRLVLTDPKRGAFAKQIEVHRRALPSGYRTLYRVATPEHERGIVLLVAEAASEGGLWMYFPTSDHLLRVASRGLSALASDWSCEDLKLAFPLADYRFRVLDRVELDGASCLRVEMAPAQLRLQRELGFARAVGWVREDIAMIVRSEYFDRSGRLFKTFRAEEVRQVQGIWTAFKTTMVNHRVDHRSEARFSDVRYFLDLSQRAFGPEALRGVSRGEEGRR